MNRDDLYLRLVEELQRVVETPGDDFDLLQTSAHLRKLLLDEDPLAHQVNRERRLRLRFVASAEDAYTRLVLEDGPSFWAWMDGFSPRLAVRAKETETLTIDQLLAKRAALVAGHDVSVKDVILQVAHVSGGVHAGTPRTELEHRLAEASQALRVGGVSSISRTLRGIADVVVGGLEPLTDQVRR